MRFSTVFSALLAAVSIGVNAAPIAEADLSVVATEPSPVTDLVTRGKDDSAAYNAVEKAAGSSKLEVDKYYVFTLEWPLKKPVGDGDAETASELDQLRKQLGFEHIGFIVGQVTSKETGPPKKKKTVKDFNGMLYHMIKKTDGKVDVKSTTWKPDDKTLKYLKTTNKSKAGGVKKAASDYIADHPQYAVKGNNCNDFVKSVTGGL
ncbi:hypothetical protein K469DRAFT_751407 [Zopfia rhizophila CBS 207.26]|uniref:Uncharacterized protein n=1 Tax=Zopfia rhizophila CBS 207.26 TaxID=1314779 RepID=A0A6A6DY30_9PEZI|nr:hypothetical protein K469DRAFT_751407 [Zopfia rhizophila CBS 207.26]